jgi:hypothetical protein
VQLYPEFHFKLSPESTLFSLQTSAFSPVAYRRVFRQNPLE